MPPSKRQAILSFGKSELSEAPEHDSRASIASTDDATLDTSPEASRSATPSLPLPKSKNKKSVRTAWVYKYMRGTADMQEVLYNAEGKEEWRCRYCTQNYLLSGGNTAIKKHLNSQHDIFEDSAADAKAKNVQIAIDSAIYSAVGNPHKRRKLVDSEGREDPLDGDVLEVLYVRFIAACNIPLRLVENQDFRAFLTYLNPGVSRWLPASHSTIRNWVMRQFELEKGHVKLSLQNAKTRIHISLDIWTSPANKSIIGVVAHYITKEGVLERSVLAMREVEGTHNGENLATLIMEIICEWEIQEKLGYVVMDNATNNDTMMRYISKGKCSPDA
jgi:hypothetical protein